MKVWIISVLTNYTGYQIVGVFDSELEAIDYKETDLSGNEIKSIKTTCLEMNTPINYFVNKRCKK